METARGQLTPAFAVQLVQRLRDQDPKFTPALVWIEEELRAQQLDTERVVQEEHQRQGASNVTVRNIITSMRLMTDVDWAEFFESVSLVDETLNASSDFAVHGFRDAQPVSQCHRAAGARRTAVGAGHRQAGARAWRQGATDQRQRDPGFYLIAEGRPKLERLIGFHARLRDLPSRISVTVGAGDYVAAIWPSPADCCWPRRWR